MFLRTQEEQSMDIKLQRYKHDLPVSYTLGATLTFELLKQRPELLTRVFIMSQTEDKGGIHELLSLFEVTPG